MATVNRTETGKQRNEKGQFLPGNKNGGRPKIPDDIKETFRAMTPLAVARLQELLSSPETDDKVLIQAINTCLDRAWGKAPQAIDMNVEQNAPFEITIRRVKPDGY